MVKQFDQFDHQKQFDQFDHPFEVECLNLRVAAGHFVRVCVRACVRVCVRESV